MRVFVLMPFNDDLDLVFQELIHKPLHKAGFEVERADTELHQRNILSDIVNGLARADLIIADLTGLNPNVMYELGLAHGLQKPTVILTQDIGELPFDLRAYRANKYSVHFTKATALAESLTSIAEGLRKGDVEFSNPISDFALGSVPSHGLSQPPNESQQVHVATEDDVNEGSGLPELMEKIEEATHTSSDFMALLNEETEVFKEKLFSAIGEVPTSSKGASRPQIREVVDKVTQVLNSYSDRVNQEIPEFRLSVNNISKAGDSLARRPVIEFLENQDKVREIIANLARTEKGMERPVKDITEVRNSLPAYAQMNISRDLNRAIRKSTDTLDEILGGFSELQLYAERTKSILLERLESDVQEV